MLRLPAPGEVLPPLVAPAHEPQTSAGEVHEHRSRHGHGRRRREHPSWEEDGRKRSSNSDRLVIGGVALALLAITAGAVLLLQSKPHPQRVSPAPDPVAVRPLEPEPVQKAPVIDVNDPKALVEAAEPLAKSFLNARQVSDILPLIRHPETSGPRLKQKWPGDNVTPEGFSSFAEGGGVAVEGDVMAATVVTGGFKNRLMYFGKTDQGWKIDWESWVDWSTTSWADFIAKKPVTPVPFRVVITETNYYNFGFSDEKKWRSVFLESADGERNLYGYIERNSETDKLVNFQGRPRGIHCIVELRYLEGGRPDQVAVGRILSQTWVAPESKDKP